MKRIHSRKSLFIAVCAICFGLLVWITAMLILPSIVRGKVVSLAAGAGVDLSGLVVESAGPRGILVRDAVLEIKDVRARIPLLEMEYTLPSILRGDFNSARISGSRVDLKLSGRQIRLTDLNGTLRLERPGTPSEGEWMFKGEARLNGNPLNLDARLERLTGGGHAVLKCGDLAAESLLKFIPHVDALLARGTLAFIVDVGISDWQPQEVRFSLHADRVRLGYAGVEAVLAGKARGNLRKEPQSHALHAELKIAGIEYGPYLIAEPFAARIDVESATGMRAEFGTISVQKPLGLTIEGLQAHTAGSPLDAEVLLSGGLVFRPGPFLERMPDVQFSGRIRNKARGLGWSLHADTAGPLRGRFGVSTFSAGLRAGFRAEGMGGKGSARVHVRAGNVHLGDNQWRLQIPGLRADGRIGIGLQPTYRGVVQFRDGEFSYPEAGVQCSGISGKVPVTSGEPADAMPVYIKQGDVSAVSLKNIRAEAAVRGLSAAASGVADLSKGPLKIRFHAGANVLSGGDLFQVDFSLPRTELNAGSELGDSIPFLGGFTGGGGIGLKGAVKYASGSGLETTAEVVLSDLSLKQREMNLDIAGLSGSIYFDRLHELHTSPSQRLDFRSLSLGPAKVGRGRVQVQLHDETGGLLERMDFSFCGGRVTTTAFRFPAWETGMEFSLICEGLRLADLLNMVVGKENATGEGTISGVIPIRIGAGGISFQAAHLATSPGETGTLQVIDPEEMAGGILLAEESIRDFTYDWAKVNIMESKDILNMTVQLSGKPRRKLPLKFDPAKKDFVRDPSGQRHVDLKGLLLELKFVDIDVNGLLREAGLFKEREEAL